MRAVISRLSPLRPTATSPASPDEASTPANVTSVSVNAKTRSLADGVPPRLAGCGEHVGVEHDRQAEDHDRGLQDQVDDHDVREALVALGARAADVEPRHPDDHRGAAQELREPARQRGEHDREVVRRRERGDRHQQDVVEQDRPAGDEAEQLVERVARDDRRAAALLVQRRALDVGEHQQAEEHGRDEEDEPRVAERGLDDEPEREVDRRGDEALDDPEQRRRAEPALAAPSASPAATAASRAARASPAALHPQAASSRENEQHAEQDPDRERPAARDSVMRDHHDAEHDHRRGQEQRDRAHEITGTRAMRRARCARRAPTR